MTMIPHDARLHIGSLLFESIDQIDLTGPVRVIDVLAYPAVQVLDVTGPIQVFASANDLVAGAGGARPYVFRVVAQGGEAVTASAGVALAADPLTKLDEALDTLLVAGGPGAEAAAENLVLVERVASERRRRVASPQSAPARSCLLQPGCWTGAAQRPTGCTAKSLPSAFPPCMSSLIRFSSATVGFGLQPG
jgi:hypothetical protein